MVLSMFLMVTKMVALVLPVAKEEGTPVARPDGRRWVCPAHLPHVSYVPNVPQYVPAHENVFPRFCLPLNLSAACAGVVANRIIDAT